MNTYFTLIRGGLDQSAAHEPNLRFLLKRDVLRKLKQSLLISGHVDIFVSELFGHIGFLDMARDPSCCSDLGRLFREKLIRVAGYNNVFASRDSLDRYLEKRAGNRSHLWPDEEREHARFLFEAIGTGDAATTPVNEFKLREAYSASIRSDLVRMASRCSEPLQAVCNELLRAIDDAKGQCRLSSLHSLLDASVQHTNLEVGGRDSLQWTIQLLKSSMKFHMTRSIAEQIGSVYGYSMDHALLGGSAAPVCNDPGAEGVINAQFDDCDLSQILNFRQSSDFIRGCDVLSRLTSSPMCVNVVAQMIGRGLNLGLYRLCAFADDPQAIEAELGNISVSCRPAMSVLRSMLQEFEKTREHARMVIDGEPVTSAVREYYVRQISGSPR